MSFYFLRTGANQYTATPLTSGAWNVEEQHISPSLGLVMHIAEADHASRRQDRLSVGRVTYEIYGVVPIAAYDYSVRVIRPGRTIELVEVVLEHAGRTIVNARIWFMAPGDSSAVAGTTLPAIKPREQMASYPPSSDWQGQFLETLEGWRDQQEPGRAGYWARSTVQLIDDAQASPFATACGLMDIANGMTVREDPTKVAFPNVDLTAHFFRVPEFAPYQDGFTDWIGHDIRVSFGPGGLGLTQSVLHDAQGPYGMVAQSLTVRT